MMHLKNDELLEPSTYACTSNQRPEIHVSQNSVQSDLSLMMSDLFLGNICFLKYGSNAQAH